MSEWAQVRLVALSSSRSAFDNLHVTQMGRVESFVHQHEIKQSLGAFSNELDAYVQRFDVRMRVLLA